MNNNENDKLNNRSRINRNTTPNRYGTYRNNLNNNPNDTVPFPNSKVENSKTVNNPNNKEMKPTGNLKKDELVDKSSKVLDKLGPKGKAASKALKTANKAYNKAKEEIPKALQNSNHVPSFFNRKNNPKEENKKTTDEKEETKDNSEDDSDDNKGVKEKGTLSVSVKTKIIIVLSVVALCTILLIVLLQVVISPISSILSIFSLNSWNSEEKEYVYDKDNEENRKANEEYNNYILGSDDGSVKGIVPYFQETYGVTLDWVMLDTVIQYRFLSLQNGSLYSNEGLEDITEEELNKRLEELQGSSEGEDEENKENSGNITFGSNYNIPKIVIDYVAYLMVEPVDISLSGFNLTASNLEVGGSFYNRLIDSWFLKIYYKDILKDDEYETRKKLVDEIFEQYKFAKEAIAPNGMYGIISDNMQIYLQTCETPYNTTKNERGKFVFSNRRNINAGTNYPEYFSLTDYLKGAVEGELGRGSLTEANKEGVKAFTIATLTYMLGSFYVDFYPGVQSINFPTGNCRLVSCDVVNGCTYTKNGNTYGTAYSGTNRYGSSGVHRPWNETQNAFMDEVLAEIFGIVMVKPGVTAETFTSGDQLKGGSYYEHTSQCPHGNCMGQKEALEDSRNGMSYEEILRKYYSNFDLINIREGLYVVDATYGNVTYNNGNFIVYDQNDYRNKAFCGRSDGTIASSGCGVTAAAIVMSTFTGNKQYDPVYFSDLARKKGKCGTGISGTIASFFSDVVDEFNKMNYNFKYVHVTKGNAKQVIDILNKGNAMVIAHMGAGTFTNGGHYIVLAGVNDKGEVYVLDPNNKRNGKGNKWYDFESIVAKQSKTGFYAIIKES